MNNADTKPFNSMAIDDNQAGSIEAIRKAYAELLGYLRMYGVQSRELSIAITELETSCMWAVKSVTHNNMIKVQQQTEIPMDGISSPAA